MKSRFKPRLFAATLLSFGVLASVGCEPPQVPQPVVTQVPTHFDTKMDSDKLVLVKFGATWCPPCRAVDSELEQLAGQLPPDVEVLKIDVDENPELAERYRISGIPRMMLVRDGKILDQEEGYMSGGQIQNWLAKYSDNSSAN